MTIRPDWSTLSGLGRIDAIGLCLSRSIDVCSSSESTIDSTPASLSYPSPIDCCLGSEIWMESAEMSALASPSDCSSILSNFFF